MNASPEAPTTIGVVVVPSDFDESIPIGGLSPILRQILAFQSARVASVTLVGRASAPTDARISVPILAEIPAHGRALVARADVTSHRQVPSRLAASADLDAHPVTRIGDDRAAIYFVRGECTADVVGALASDRSIDAESLPMIGGVSAEFVVRARTATERRRATFDHLVSLRKPTSGYFERLYMRPMSMWMTWALCRSRVTPNQMTVLTFLLGLGSAVLVALPGDANLRAGALLHLFMRVVDCVDGELSRLRYQGSQLGAWLDSVGDGIAMTAFVAGLGYRLDAVSSPYAVVGYAGAAMWLVVKAFEWRGAYLAESGGMLQTIEWGHRAKERTFVERFVGRIELLLRLDAISTYFGVLLLCGVVVPLVIGHTVLATAAAAYYATQIGKLGRRAA